MAEVVAGRWKPTPGQDLESFELPGVGTYEAEFRVPSIVAEALTGNIYDGVSENPLQFERTINGTRIRHVRTSVDWNKRVVRNNAFDELPLIVRFEVLEVGPQTTPGVAEANVGVILRVILGVVAGALAAVILTQIAKALVEVRRIIQTPAGAVLGAGAGVALVGVGLLLLGKR